MNWGRKWLVDFKAAKFQLVSFDWSNTTGAIDVKLDRSVLQEKLSFKMLGLTFLLIWIQAVILSLLSKLAPRKLETWFVLWRFFLLSLHCIYKSTIRPCLEYYCHVWTGAPSCYLELLYKLQKQICRTVGLSLVASPELLAHHQNISNLSLFYRYYFWEFLSKMAQVVFFLYSWGISTF